MKKTFKLVSLMLVLAMLLISASSCKKDKGNEGSSGNDNQNGEGSGDNSTSDSLVNIFDLDVASESLFVTKVENMPEDFIMGMDASCVPALEDSGVKYYDHEGNEKDVYEILRDNGINYIRVRIWNDPYDKNGNGYGGGNCDVENAIEIGQRATKYGLKLLINFHYSDFWAAHESSRAPNRRTGIRRI